MGRVGFERFEEKRRRKRAELRLGSNFESRRIHHRLVRTPVGKVLTHLCRIGRHGVDFKLCLGKALVTAPSAVHVPMKIL